MTNDMYARARVLVVQSLIGYDEDDHPGALATVIGEMMLEALDLGLGAHDLAEELRAIAARIDSAPAEEDAADAAEAIFSVEEGIYTVTEESSGDFITAKRGE